MKFGLALSNNDARTVAQQAQLAEQTGWDGIFLGDFIWCQDPMIALAAAAMTTKRIRLGTMVTPAPIRRPWKIASESVAVDHLSDGRFTLGLGTGAVWMGWQAFPDEIIDVKNRAEHLDETIDILTLMFKGKPFDFEGKHHNVKLTRLEEIHYPPKPIQQPRIPIWAPAIWPRQKAMKRAMKCDGFLPEVWTSDGPGEVTPDDVADMKLYIEEERTLTTPYDIVMSGKITGLSTSEQKDRLAEWQKVGVTWWIEFFWGDAEERVSKVIQQGPPQ
jgi:alkanesulfonate monooxygenase SsuD/methylene tetrahydromethanopterin reductase-like flavin-dependent oxidoreductase (luciferase family)